MTFHRLGLAAAFAVLVAGCFHPTFKDGIACGPGDDCPPGQTCGTDRRCHAGGELDIDAAPATPDAAQVGCQQDVDCQNPPDVCSTPGTCDLALHMCAFGKVDCASMSDECNAGVCDVAAGGCVKQAAHQGAACGQGIVCGAFGACGGFSDTCDSTGTQSRSCTQFTCQSGTCTGTDLTDTQACTRTTNGTVCGSSTVSNCGACTGSSENGCALDGHQTCTCTDMVCMNDSCQAVSSSCTQTGCAESLPGDDCGVSGAGCPAGKFRALCCSGAHTCIFCSPCQ